MKINGQEILNAEMRARLCLFVCECLLYLAPLVLLCPRVLLVPKVIRENE